MIDDCTLQGLDLPNVNDDLLPVYLSLSFINTGVCVEGVVLGWSIVQCTWKVHLLGFFRIISASDLQQKSFYSALLKRLLCLHCQEFVPENQLLGTKCHKGTVLNM